MVQEKYRDKLFVTRCSFNFFKIFFREEMLDWLAVNELRNMEIA